MTQQVRLGFSTVIGVEHSPTERMNRILTGIEALLRAEPLLDPTSIGVHLVGLTDSAMNIELSAQFTTTDGAAFAKARQALLLGIVAVIEQAGTALAHPTRTLELRTTERQRLSEHASVSHDSVPESGDRGAARLSKSG